MFFWQENIEELPDAEAVIKRSILGSPIFLKEKRDGTFNVRTLSGGKKQMDFIYKEDSSSQIVSI